MTATLLLPPEVPTRARRTLVRFAAALGAQTLADGLAHAPAAGFLLHWLGGGEGKGLAASHAAATRLVLLAPARAGLRPLATRLHPAALVEEEAFQRWEIGLPTTAGGGSGLIGLKQAPLPAATSLGVGDYVIFDGSGEPLTDLLTRYLEWRAAATVE